MIRFWCTEQLKRRPWWMNILMFFCAWMAFVYVPWDFFFKSVSRDEEVWFGLMLNGWAAKATEPLHWAIYMAGAYGFWRMRPWMWPWAAVYTVQIAVGSFVWNVIYVGGLPGWVTAVVSAIFLGFVADSLWRSRDRFRSQRPPLRERYGEWALITGASAGIGAAFARACAREGMSCVLVARREERLREIATEIENAHAVETRIVVADLATPTGQRAVVEAVNDLPLGLLVNNAGFGIAGRFVQQDLQRLEEMIRLNCVAPVTLTRLLLPSMMQRGRGAVIIVGSVAGDQPVPFNGVYGATKAFDQRFGEAIWAELLGSGIDVLVLQPGATETEFQAVAGELPHAGQSAEEVVATALEALGRQPSVIAGWGNWLRSFSTRFAPRPLLTLVAGRIMQRWVKS